MQTTKDLIESLLNGKTPTDITVAELSLLLQRNDGERANFISMVMSTDARLAKTGNPYRDEKVYKVSKYNVQINVNYSNAVNNQLEREGKERNFEAQENWHSKKFDEFNGSVVEHASGNSSQEYLAYRVLDVERIGFTINDKIATPEQVETIKVFLPKKSPAKNQGTEKEIRWQTVKYENIKLLSINNEFYRVTG